MQNDSENFQEVGNASVSIEQRLTEPDARLCLEYIQMTESGMSQIQIAEQWDVHRNTVRNRVISWTRSGLLPDLRAYILHDAKEAMTIAVNSLLRDMPDLISEAVSIARTAKSPKTRLEAIQWLYHYVAKPALDEIQEPGADELDYADSQPDFDPMNIGFKVEVKPISRSQVIKGVVAGKRAAASKVQEGTMPDSEV